MRLTISIETGNAAFGNDSNSRADECARILHALADRFTHRGDLPESLPLKDTNGNTVGTVSFEDADTADDEEKEEFVIVDQRGNVYYEDDEAETGWTDENEAEREARGFESRGEGSFQVVRKSEV